MASHLTAAHVLSVAAHLHAHAHAGLQHHHRITDTPFDYGGLAVAAAASWIGVPGPGEPVLIAAGVLAAQHRLALVPVLIVAWLSATAGGIIGWMIGRRAGRSLLTGPGPLRSMRIRAAERGEAVFASYPVVGVVLAPSWISGINRVRPAVYHTVNAAAAVIWAGGVGIGGYLVGPTVIDVVDNVGTVTAILLVVLIVAALGLEARRRRVRSGRER